MDIRSLQTNEPQNIQYIKNPLPTPKKHVKKEMSYDIEVPEHMMFYDIEIQSNDDFDLM